MKKEEFRYHTLILFASQEIILISYKKWGYSFEFTNENKWFSNLNNYYVKVTTFVFFSFIYR